MPDLVLTRTFAAPAADVFAAWTDPRLVRRWWGPAGFTCSVAEMDVRVGGRSLVCMRAPAEWGGMELYNTWDYRLVEPGRRLEFVLRFCDREGRPLAPEALGLPGGVPAEVPHVLTFSDRDGGASEMTITEAGYTSAEAVETSRAGLVQTLDKLAGAIER